jgi:hypothetical protein
MLTFTFLTSNDQSQRIRTINIFESSRSPRLTSQTPITPRTFEMGIRLRANMRIYGQSNSWKGSIIVDSSAPESVVDARILKQIGAECTGEFSRGIASGANTPARLNSFTVEIPSDVDGIVRLKVFQADIGHTDTRALLGIDWFGLQT